MKRTRDLLFSDEDATVIRTVVPASDIAGHKPRSRIVTLALLLKVVLLTIAWLVMLGVAWLALAASDDQANAWRGVTDREVAITLILPSSQDAKLTFGAPRFCTLLARLETGNDYSLRESNGGYCDRLLGGHMKLTANADTARLSVRLIDDKGAVRDTAELSAANRTDEPPPGD